MHFHLCFLSQYRNFKAKHRWNCNNLDSYKKSPMLKGYQILSSIWCNLLSIIISFVRFVWTVNKISPPLKSFYLDNVNSIYFSFYPYSHFWKHKDHFLRSPHIYGTKGKTFKGYSSVSPSKQQKSNTKFLQKLLFLWENFI